MSAVPVEPPSEGATRSRQVSPAPILPPLTVVDRVRLGVEVLAAYARARWQLQRSDLVTTVEALRRHAGGQAAERTGLETRWQSVRLAKATRRTLSLLPGDTRCLMQSLVLTRLLAQRRIESRLIVAADPSPRFRAHAWVEHEGRPLLPAGEYGRLVEL